MAQASKIEWTDATWNPTRGCSRVSEGCRNCYAERQAARFTLRGRDDGGITMIEPGPFAEFVTEVNGHASWTGKVELIESMLDWPLRKKKPLRIFVNSMSDLFHEALPDDAIDRVFAVMGLSPWHTFQILTKRAERMAEYCKALTFERLRHWMNLAVDGGEHRPGAYNLTSIAHTSKKGTGFEFRRNPGPPYPNVQLGVSVEDEKTMAQRWPALRSIPAAKRFISYEPALGRIDFSAYFPNTLWALPVDPPDWIIVGGESGPGARPFDIGWARQTVVQCRAAGIAVFVKQLGADPREGNANGNCRNLDCTHPDCGYIRLKLADRKGGSMEEWPEDLRVREFPSEVRA